MATAPNLRDVATPANALTRAARRPGPADEWAALAPLLAARGRMRVSRDGGRNYRLRDERTVTEDLPNQPAALLTYDHTGRAPVVIFDLDASRGDTGRDHATLTRLLDRHSAAWFSDTSPNGGRHVYVPLRHGAPLHEVREVMKYLTTSLPTLDPLPMLNLHAGCVRPPGARHKSGGHQRLDQPIAAAVGAMKQPTADGAWSWLVEQAHHSPAVATQKSAADDEMHNVTSLADRLEGLHGHHAPDDRYLDIARTGTWDATRYATASEARQAVVWAAAAAGWEFADVARRTEDGTWPGLASLYARYGTAGRRTALVRDWRRAVRFETDRRKRRANNEREGSVHERTTSQHQTQRGQARADLVVGQEVRVWLAAVDLLARSRGSWLGLGEKAVLYALAEAAVLTGGLEVEHGNRSLAIATGMDQATVGRCLRKLRAAPPDALLIDQVREADGPRAHCYRLVIPDLLRPACEKKPWRLGKIHAIRPAFRELGLAAAFVYGALERSREALTGREIATEAGVGHSAGAAALQELASWGLAERAEGKWQVGAASLVRLAEQWGIDVQVAEQVARYRAERRLWWVRLGLWGRLIDDPPTIGDPWAPEPDLPPDDGYSPAPPLATASVVSLHERERDAVAEALVRSVLGGVPVSP